MRIRQLELTQAAAKGRQRADRPRGRMLEAPEADVQVAIVRALELAGYTVLVTTRVRLRCSYCGRLDHRGDGCTPGLPDLVVTHSEWPRWMACLIEVKGTRTPLSPEQANLHGAGRMLVARTVEQAWFGLRDWEIENAGRLYGRDVGQEWRRPEGEDAL